MTDLINFDDLDIHQKVEGENFFRVMWSNTNRCIGYLDCNMTIFFHYAKCSSVNLTDEEIEYIKMRLI